MKKALLIIVGIISALMIPSGIYILIVGLLDYILKPHHNLQLCLLLSFFPTMVIYPFLSFPVFNLFVYLLGEKNWNGFFKLSNKFDDFFQLFSIPWLLMGMFMPILIFILLKIKTSTIILCVMIGLFAGTLFPVGGNILRLFFRYKDPKHYYYK